MAESRRLAVLDGDRRVDVSVPLDGTLGDVLGGLGIGGGADRVPLLDGVAADPATPVADLRDGALVALVDPSAVLAGPARRAHATGATEARGLWWAQAAVGLVLLVVAGASDAAQLWPAVVLGVCAVGGALAVALGSAAAGAARVAGPVTLAAAAVAFALPRGVTGAGHLALVAGSLALAILLVLGVVAARVGTHRAAWGAAAVILLVVAAIWAVVLVLGWPASIAAAATAGAVPLGVRALPSALLTVPDGHFLDYARHMDTHWTVRGSVPGPVPTTDAAMVAEKVRGAVAAQVSGTVLLCAIGAVALPAAVPPRLAEGGGAAQGIGRVALVVCFGLALALLARGVGLRGLPWVPRAAAAVAVVVGVRLALAGDSTVAGLVAAGALLAGLALAGAEVAIARGARSLAVSRLADALEGLTVALCLPAGLLAGGILETLRSFVA